MLKTIHLTGKNETDLNNKQSDWEKSANVVIVEVHPDEPLPLTVPARPRYSKLEAVDRLLRRIDYYERGR